MKNKFFYLAIIILFTGCVSKHNQQKFKICRAPYKSISPFVSNLLEIDSNQLKIEAEKIWELGKQEGFPIIEKDPSFDDYVYLTLLYQDSTDHKEISFKMFGIYDEYRFGDMKMHRLAQTDLYYRSYIIPNDLCFSYRYKILDTLSGEYTYNIDKFNSDRIPKNIIKKSSYSVLDLDPPKEDWNAARYDHLTSKVDTIMFESIILNNERKVHIYLPPDYSDQKNYPIIYLFDAHIYMNRVQVPNILDNMISEGLIEPMMAVMIANPTSSSRYKELPLNFEFKSFLIEELVPYIRKNYHSSTLPKDNYIGGISYGGLASTFIAYYHPDVFGKVISQSASYWRGLELADKFDNEVRSDWLIDKINQEENRNIKLFLDWGLQENMVLGANRKFAQILSKKGYDFKFQEFNGWHDWSNSRKTFPNALEFLTKN